MKKYIYAITEFNNDDYIRTLKGYTNEKTAIDECNELNGYTNDLSKWYDELAKYKVNCKELKELKPLYQELIIIWRERAYITPNNNEELLKENEIKFNDVLERIKDVENDVEVKWKADNPFHSTRENKNGSIFNVITIEIETETFIQRLLNFFKTK